MHRADKYSEHSSIIWTIWLHGGVFVYEQSGCEFEKLRLSQETSFLIKKRVNSIINFKKKLFTLFVKLFQSDLMRMKELPFIY